jgi:Xaa-Pro aminopeptidase
LPSEAIFWGPSAKDYPAFENLDALWLTGADPGRPVRLPGTSPLLGRLFLHRFVAPLRARHDAAEVALHRQSAQVTVAALRAALPLYRAGAKEADVAAAIRQAYLAQGCQGDSFPPIVASGKSAAPHGEDNVGWLGPRELVVTDVGCSVQHHTADFTRTLPVGGRFTPEGRRLYEAVLAAQAAAAKACRPGVGLTRDFGGQKSLDAISRETLKARGVEGDYPHGLGHTVGLFVHDVGGRSEPLAAGMLVTLEPGLYRKGSLGIRLEDTYLVTETGCEPITTGLPSDPDELEALMAAGR